MSGTQVKETVYQTNLATANDVGTPWHGIEFNSVQRASGTGDFSDIKIGKRFTKVSMT